MGETVIRTDADVITLINIFSVEPSDQRRLVELLDQATEQVMRDRPGFVSANIHASLDGSRVANYAQWATQEDFQAMLADPAAQEHMAQAYEIAKVEPTLYKVASVHHR